MKDFEKDFFISGMAGKIQCYGHRADKNGVFFDQKKVAIICHPHPQQGGTMDNKVVTSLMRTYRDLGIDVIRFNFRGVAESEGDFAQGIGEYDDLMAVVRWVIREFTEYDLLLAGFSFGSSIAARASYSTPGLQHLTLVAPPIERYEYDKNSCFPVPICVLQGDLDERVNAHGVYDWFNQLQSPGELIRYAEATHFFHGYLSQIKNDLGQCLLSQLAARSGLSY